MGKSLGARIHHGSIGDNLPVDPHAVRGRFGNRHCALYHFRKADSLEEGRNEGEAPVGGHLPSGERNFYFVHLAHHGTFLVHCFIPPSAWDLSLADD